MNLQDVARIFHEPGECGGIITSDEAGYLKCAECHGTVGWLQPSVLQAFIEVFSRVPDEAKR
jgi:hypothetical protein